MQEAHHQRFAVLEELAVLKEQGHMDRHALQQLAVHAGEDATVERPEDLDRYVLVQGEEAAERLAMAAHRDRQELGDMGSQPGKLGDRLCLVDKDAPLLLQRLHHLAEEGIEAGKLCGPEPGVAVDARRLLGQALIPDEHAQGPDLHDRAGGFAGRLQEVGGRRVDRHVAPDLVDQGELFVSICQLGT